MTLSGVKKGDIVQVGGALAYVMDKRRGELFLRWHKTTNTRWVRARECEAHWRRTAA